MATVKSSMRGALALIVGAGLVVFVPSLFTRDPWNPDEPRAVEVAREMVVLGNYLVPHLNGEPYSEKPPLFYWLAAGFWHLGAGLNSGRMVSALAATGTALLVYALGRRVHSPETGLVAALITMASALLVYIGKYGVLDPLLAFLTTASVYSSTRAFEGGAGRGRWWLAAYAAAALAVLAKGPPGLAVAVAAPLAYGFALRREVRKGGWWHLAGGALLAGIVAAWLVPACLSGGKAYAHDILLQQTAKRISGAAPHENPPYFYLARFPIIFAPWTLILVAALAWAARSARAQRDRAGLLAAAWLAVVFVCFSLFAGKRERYLLPLIPAVGLLCARYVAGVARGEHPPLRWHHALWRATFAAIGACAIGLAVVALAPGVGAAELVSDPAMQAELKGLVTPLGRAAAFAAALFVLAACLWGILSQRGAAGERRRVIATLAAVAILSIYIDLGATPPLNQVWSGRQLLVRAGRFFAEADEVYLYRDDLNGTLNLFSARVRIPVLQDEAALNAVVRSGRKVAVVLKESDAETLGDRVPWHKVARRLVVHRPTCVMANWKP